MSGDRLTLYLLGPGVGESVVAIMPDGRVIVVDSCVDGGVNLPARVVHRPPIHWLNSLSAR